MDKKELKYNGITKEQILPQVFSLISRNAWNYTQRRITHKDMTNASYNILGVVYQKPGISQDQIARMLSIDKSQCAKMIARAESRGYLMREKDKQDHRIMHVSLTEDGKNAIEELLSTVNEWQTEVLSSFTDKQKKDLMHALHQIEETSENLK